MTIAASRRRADSDEDRVRRANRFSPVQCKGQAAVADVGGDQILEPRLIDRHPPRVQLVDLARVLVDAGHDMAEVGETGPGNKPDIAGADHCDAHAVILSIQFSRNSLGAGLFPADDHLQAKKKGGRPEWIDRP
ncbi:hypothetical protein D3C81_1756030 [compost metagenome]